MNALGKILQPLTVIINNLFDRMNPRTADMIRQSYLFIIVTICIGGLILGVTLGKHAAKKTGIQMAETTNQIFDLDIKQSRGEGGFGSLIDSETENEASRKDLVKEPAPGREHAIADDSATIVEPERDRHIKTTPDAVERNELPAVPRLDETDPFVDNDVKRIEPKHGERAKADLTGASEHSTIEQKSVVRPGKAEAAKPKSGDDIRGPVKTKTPKTKIKPMEKKEAVAE